MKIIDYDNHETMKTMKTMKLEYHSNLRNKISQNISMFEANVRAIAIC